MFKPMKEGGVVQSVKSSRHIESSKNLNLSRINWVHDIVSQFEQSCFCRKELREKGLCSREIREKGPASVHI